MTQPSLVPLGLDTISLLPSPCRSCIRWEVGPERSGKVAGAGQAEFEKEVWLSGVMLTWARNPNLWVRRASAVALIPSVRRGRTLDIAYKIARRLHADREDLLQKAVGWMLREAGKADPARLETYLRANGARIPRTTVRYAIERFPSAKRRELLVVTKGRAELRAL